MYVIVRTYSAGVFAGQLVKRDGQEVTLQGARRLWQWFGAASLSELAVRGTSQPQKCKFPVEMPEVVLLDAIEVITTTPEAQQSIAAVPVWSV